MKTLTIQHLTKGTATGYPEKGWGGGGGRGRSGEEHGPKG